MRRVASLLVIVACTGGSGFSCLSAAEDPHCCAPDPRPDCCMVYGGWSQSGGCGSFCDGMPLPNDPGWKLGTDSHGCSVWTNRGLSSPTTPFCGGVSPTDGGSDAADANPADASLD